MPTTEDRFWAKVVKTDGCWVWTGSKRNKGYGAFCYVRNGLVVQGRAHRYSYEIHRGQIPDGLFVLHTCDNPACVKPEHLWIGTNADNVADMMKKGRHVKAGTYCRMVDGRKGNYRRGSNHHNAKLTQSVVDEIRRKRSEGMSYSKLATMFGIAVMHAHRIVNRKAWK